jgi:methyl-accepting chemotaxis protein
MITGEHRSSTLRRLLGAGILVAVILIAGAFLEAAVDDGTESWLLRAYLVIGILAVVSYLFLVFFPQRRLEAQLEEVEARYEAQCRAITESLDEMRHGDLVAALEPLGNLPADMQGVVKATTGSLAGLFQQIQNSSVEVATSAGGVRDTAADLAAGSSEQAAAVVEITATMEELARTAGTVARNAATQADLAAQAEAAGIDGAEALRSAVEGVEAVQHGIEVIADRADTLGSRAREIYRVLDLITEIAHETHILSLNAAIEAAAAGEHGERFAVVAEEVRRLAERSRESVDSVRSMLDEFSAAIRAVVVSTEEGSKSASRVLDESHATRQSMEHLRNALGATASAAREISLATEEQRAASDQVVVTLKEVSEVIQRMADGLAQFTGAADALNRLALTIQLLSQSFRLDSSHSLKNHSVSWAEQLSAATANPEALEGYLDDLLDELGYVELTYVVDPDGILMAMALNSELTLDTEGPEPIEVGQSFADRGWFQSVRREHRTVVTPVYESLLTGGTCFTVATPIFDRDGTLFGVLGTDVNVDNWTRI